MYDGGSISYVSFIYSAFESRRREASKDEDGNELWGPGYQGYSWKWNHVNTLWIAGLLAISFLLVARRLHTLKNPAEHAGDGKPGPVSS